MTGIQPNFTPKSYHQKAPMKHYQHTKRIIELPPLSHSTRLVCDKTPRIPLAASPLSPATSWLLGTRRMGDGPLFSPPVPLKLQGSRCSLTTYSATPNQRYGVFWRGRPDPVHRAPDGALRSSPVKVLPPVRGDAQAKHREPPQESAVFLPVSLDIIGANNQQTHSCCQPACPSSPGLFA